MPAEDRHDGVQRKVWIPESLNQTVEKLAASSGISISGVLRQLIADGLHREAQSEAATAQIIDMLSSALQPLASRIDHLERLLFYTAQSAGIMAVNLEVSAKQQAQKAFPNDPDRAEDVAQSTVGKMQKMAHERLNKALRGPRPTLEEAD